MEIVTCPLEGCDQPASVSEWRVVPSTHGTVRFVRMTCLDRHWFIEPEAGPAAPPAL
jgi:hypothetical protein